MNLREARLSAGLVAIGLLVSLALGEVLVRSFLPVASLYPRYKYSREYGLVLFPGARMIHTRPGHFRFRYTINELGYRGEAVPLSRTYLTHNVVVLGDSYSFGQGVDDGDEFPSRLGRLLGEGYRVINLATPSWGLTQEVRRYSDFGRHYQPSLVILQFCENDLEDNLNNRVALTEDGSIRFVDSNSSINWTKQYLSRSALQKSQLYNLVRERLYEFARRRIIRREEALNSAAAPFPLEVPFQERVYSDLLTAFSRMTHQDGVRLIMISVNGQLEKFTHIRKTVCRLQNEGSLEYLDVRPWFAGVTDYQSPEGHIWGSLGHQIMAEHLFQAITQRPEGR
jgi:hypothetical protein